MSKISARLRALASDEGAWHIIDDTYREAADTIDALEKSLKRLLLEFDFLIESGELPDVRNDIIFVAAHAALAKAKGGENG